MVLIWCERALPARFAHLLDGAQASAAPGDLARAHGIVAAARLRYDGALMDGAPKLRVIARMGIGYDNVSLADATARGIAVCNAPDAPTISTAEHACALLLAAARRLRRWRAPLPAEDGRDAYTEYDGIELKGLTLGLVGCGRIGRRVARFAQALEMKVAAYDPALTSAQAAEIGVEPAASLEALLQAADVVSLHLPLSAGTRRLINAERLGQMKPGAILINTARGGLVDEAALLNALDAGRLGGAGLDVFEREPPAPDDALLRHPLVIATPHVAGAGDASRDRLWTAALTQALQTLRGERPPHLLNPEVWPRLRAMQP